MDALFFKSDDVTNFAFRFAERFWAKESKITHREVLKWFIGIVLVGSKLNGAVAQIIFRWL